MDWVTLAVGVAAIGFIIWTLYRQAGKQAESADADAGTADSAADMPDAPRDIVDIMSPKPIAPKFTVDGWDGYSGLQAALSLGLAEETCYPLIEAGTVPPAEVVQTVSTGAAEQTHITLSLYTGTAPEVAKSKLFQEIRIGPVPMTGEAIREVRMEILVNAEGRVTVSASVADGESVPVETVREMQGAIPVGR